MNIFIQARQFKLTRALREHVQRQLDSALCKHDGQIIHVLVSLSDINGPRGGVDKCCQVRLMIPGRPVVIVNDIQSNLYVAIDRAAARAKRTLRKLIRSRADKLKSLPLNHFASSGANPIYESSLLES